MNFLFKKNQLNSIQTANLNEFILEEREFCKLVSKGVL
jgi:hypothetical protein